MCYRLYCNVPLTREGVRAAFCARTGPRYRCSPAQSLYYWSVLLMGSVLLTLCGLWSVLLLFCGLVSCCLLCVCDPGLLQLWSLSADAPPAVFCSAAVLESVSCGLQPENQKRLGEGGKREETLADCFPGFHRVRAWVVVRRSRYTCRCERPHTYKRLRD